MLERAEVRADQNIERNLASKGHSLYVGDTRGWH